MRDFTSALLILGLSIGLSSCALQNAKEAEVSLPVVGKILDYEGFEPPLPPPNTTIYEHAANSTEGASLMERALLACLALDVKPGLDPCDCWRREAIGVIAVNTYERLGCGSSIPLGVDPMPHEGPTTEATSSADADLNLETPVTPESETQASATANASAIASITVDGMPAIVQAAEGSSPTVY